MHLGRCLQCRGKFYFLGGIGRFVISLEPAEGLLHWWGLTADESAYGSSDKIFLDSSMASY